MKKQKTFIYKCSSCGREEAKWLGRCPECGEWNTFLETAVKNENTSGAAVKRGNDRKASHTAALHVAIPLSAVDPMEGSRISSGISELDCVLGGGMMRRSAVLVGGEPGIGKSTLLLQLAAAVETNGRVLYVSGEESAGQIRLRAERLGLTSSGIDRIEILCTGSLEEIMTVLNTVKPVLVLVDSAQTLYSADAGSAPGGVNQMKYCSFELIDWVKEHDAVLFLSAHVTKEGIIAGPKMLEHMVDTVLYFEQNDKTSALSGTIDCRFLRAAKNRFGSIEEIGIFTMSEKGLTPVEDIGRLFLVRRDGETPPGVATAAVLEGTRTILVEIQALTIPAKGTISRVFSDKIDSGRVSRVSAALEKHLGLRLSDQDLYINAAGGIRVTEVGVELALACALYSARTGLPLPANIAIAGELSLTGEIRPVRRLASRVKTAASLGFNSFLGPVSDTPPANGQLAVVDIKSALKMIYK